MTGYNSSSGGFSVFLPSWLRELIRAGGGSPGGSSPPFPGGACAFFYGVAVVSGLTVLLLIPVIILFLAAIVPLGVAFLAALALFLLALLALASFCHMTGCNVFSLLSWLFNWGAWITLVIGALFANALVLLLGVLYGFISGVIVRHMWALGCSYIPGPFRRP